MWQAWAEVYPSRPDDFWHQTPRTYELLIGAAMNKRKHEREMSVQHAWINAYLQRVDKMPSLEKMIEDTTPKPVRKYTAQTEEEKNAILMSMLMGFGATLPKAPATPE